MGANYFFYAWPWSQIIGLADVFWSPPKGESEWASEDKTSEAKVFALMRGSECPKRNDPERKGTQKLKENIKQSQECDN